MMRHIGWLVLAAGCQLSGSMFKGTTTPGGGGGGGERQLRTVPSVFGMTRPEAEATLRRAGFTKEVRIDDSSACGSTVDDQVIELGRICYQSPGAGQQLPSLTIIALRIQTENPWRGDLGGGRSWFLMPDMTGLTLDQAKAKLRELGFVSREPKVKYSDEPGCRPNIVCATHPARLRRADNTSDKVLVVGAPPEAAAAAAAAAAEPATPAKPPSLGDNF